MVNGIFNYSQKLATFDRYLSIIRIMMSGNHSDNNDANNDRDDNEVCDDKSSRSS